MKNADSPDLLLPGAGYRALVQVSLLGTELGEYSLAGGIAQTLTELRSDLPHASIVLAMNEFSAGRRDEGVMRLEKTQEKFPNSQLCRAMLGTCLKLTDRSGWQGMLEVVIEDGRDECAVGLAYTILGYTDTGATAAQDGSAATMAPSPANAMWV